MSPLRLLFALALGVSLTSRSAAALGDSMEAAFKRYGTDGQRVHFYLWEGHRADVVRWDHWFSPDVEVSFDNGVAFRVRIDGDLSPSKWDYYLQMNAQGQKWALISWSAGSDAPVEWRRADGAHAVYFRRVFRFFDDHHPEARERELGVRRPQST